MQLRQPLKRVICSIKKVYTVHHLFVMKIFPKVFHSIYTHSAHIPKPPEKY